MNDNPLKRILVVDDSDLMLQITRQALEQAGFEVQVAQNMQQLEDFQGRPLDLILMDVQMPELFGDDVAMVLRAVRGVNVPIYLYSNLEPEELEERAKEAQLDGYICKHEGLDVLLGRVRNILGLETAGKRVAKEGETT
jgi:DNA-binding response OmpR family regulator